MESRLKLCKKCGSGGHVEMVTCIVCCQSFHTFCAGGALSPSATEKPYTCPLCVSCVVCGDGENCEMCAVCQKWFHKACVSDHQSYVGGRGTWRCVSCTHCVSCKTTSPGEATGSSWYEDFMYCKCCYDLRQKGNFCPLCLQCYHDSDFTTKMVQCGRCEYWVHATCEAMSDDQYEVLSDLPEEDVVFYCHLCRERRREREGEGEELTWRDAVNKFMKESFMKVLERLSPPVHTSLFSELNSLQRELKDRLWTSVSSFAEEVKGAIDRCVQTHKPLSPEAAAANDMNTIITQELVKLFPWYALECGGEGVGPVEVGEGVNCDGGEEVKMETSVSGEGDGLISDRHSTPAAVVPPVTHWPRSLLHDHCYLPPSHTAPLTPSQHHDATLTALTKAQDHRHASLGTQLSPGPMSFKTEPMELGEEEGGKVECDLRRCTLCGVSGDAPCIGAGRLLPCGMREWIHVNCAVWSAEVYEECSGVLCAVHNAISRGKLLRCDSCRDPGATVGCCCSHCTANYHFQCARDQGCVFLSNKEVFCQQHASMAPVEMVLPEREISADRCLLVDMCPDRTGRKLSKTHDPTRLCLQIGGLVIESLGELKELSDTPSYLLPNKFRARIEFWDVTDPRQTTTYTLTISCPTEEDLAPLFLEDHTPLSSVVDSNDPSTSGTVVGCESVTVGGGEEREEHVWDFLREKGRRRRRTINGAPPKKAESANKAPPRTPAPSPGLRGVARPNEGQKTPERDAPPSLTSSPSPLRVSISTSLLTPSPALLTPSLASRLALPSQLATNLHHPPHRVTRTSVVPPVRPKATVVSPVVPKVVPPVRPKATVVRPTATVAPTVIPPAGPKTTVVPTIGPKATVVPPMGPKATVVSLMVPKATVVPPMGPKATVVSPVVPKATVMPPVGPKTTVGPTIGPKASVVPPMVPKATQMGPKVEPRATVVPPMVPKATQIGPKVGPKATVGPPLGPKVSGVGRSSVQITRVPLSQLVSHLQESSSSLASASLSLLNSLTSSSSASLLPPLSALPTPPPSSLTTLTPSHITFSLATPTQATPTDSASIATAAMEMSESPLPLSPNSPPHTSPSHHHPGHPPSTSHLSQISQAHPLLLPPSLSLSAGPLNNTLSALLSTSLTRPSLPPSTVTSLSPALPSSVLPPSPAVPANAISLIAVPTISPGVPTISPGVPTISPAVPTISPGVPGSVPPAVPSDVPPSLSPAVSLSNTTAAAATNRLAVTDTTTSLLSTTVNRLPTLTNITRTTPLTLTGGTPPLLTNITGGTPPLLTGSTPPLLTGSTPPLLTNITTSTASTSLQKINHVTSLPPSHAPPPPSQDILSQLISSLQPHPHTLPTSTSAPPTSVGVAVGGVNRTAVVKTNNCSPFPSITIPTSPTPHIGTEAPPTLTPSPGLLPPGTQLTLVPVLQDSHIVLYGVPEHVVREIRRSKVGEKEQMKAIIQYAMGGASDAKSPGRKLSETGTKNRKRTRRNLHNGQPGENSNSSKSPLRVSRPQIAQPAVLSHAVGVPSDPRIAQSHPPTGQFPNSSAIKAYRIPKRKAGQIPPTTAPPTKKPSIEAAEFEQVTVVPVERARGRRSRRAPVISEGMLKESVVYQRYRAGLPTDPHSLSFSLSTPAGLTWSNTSLEELWLSVLSELQDQRHKLNLPYIPFSGSSVYRQFGLDHHLVVQLLEQLPNCERCSSYLFQYHLPQRTLPWRNERPQFNRTGTARSEGYSGMRSPQDMFSFLTCDHRPERPALDPVALEMALLSAENSGTTKPPTASDLPMAMQYRILQRSYKHQVGVFQSYIHGLGLFCRREIEAGEMVIEYAGTVIRSILTDKREKVYDAKGIGCYMFRIDADDVVDATMSGNEARFINHSCEPNCYSKVITVDGQKKIMIFALRRIVPGEELTYDYKFPLEEAKIPCNCGTRRCRRTMN